MESNDVLGALAHDLRQLGFDVEDGKQKAGKLPVPCSSVTRARTSAPTR
jgi:hypothetical protein